MGIKTVIAATTLAIVPPNETMYSFGRGALPQTIIAIGLSDAEFVEMRTTIDNGATGEITFQDGSELRLTATNNILKVDSPITVLIGKTISVDPVSVSVNF